MAGTVIVDTINSSVAGTPPVFQANGTQVGTLCRAWVNFNGTGTVAIRASFNVSSITDNGVGNYTVNFTNAMLDANYSVVAFGGTTVVNGFLMHSQGSNTTNSTSVVGINIAGPVLADFAYAHVAIFR